MRELFKVICMLRCVIPQIDTPLAETNDNNVEQWVALLPRSLESEYQHLLQEISKEHDRRTASDVFQLFRMKCLPQNNDSSTEDSPGEFADNINYGIADMITVV